MIMRPGVNTHLLIISVLRPNIKHHVCFGLLKLLILMEISPELNPTARMSNKEFLL